jgi:hypothetical protein
MSNNAVMMPGEWWFNFSGGGPMGGLYPCEASRAVSAKLIQEFDWDEDDGTHHCYQLTSINGRVLNYEYIDKAPVCRISLTRLMVLIRTALKRLAKL